MTVHRIEHAVVMDTDDLPGRGGYAVVGISDGVEQAERIFVAQNFGISDFLHDPQNQRTFYSFFRVPGGRFALVRRFAKGLRRNQTQNRLFVHTLFLKNELFEALEGLPWLLIQAQFRAAGSSDADVLTDKLPWLTVNAPLPPLEAVIDGSVVDKISASLARRVNWVEQQLGPSAVASALTALRQQGRVVLPQGAAYEQLTMLAWSMLPRPDRESMAWTQHDAQNIAGIAFPLANAADEAVQPAGGADSLALRLADLHLSSDEERRELEFRTARYGLTIRRPEEILDWLAWRDALSNVKEHIHGDEANVLADLKKLAKTAQRRRDAPWIDGEEVLEILWNNIPAAIAAGEKAPRAVGRWAKLLRDSDLHAIIFRIPPEEHWLARAAGEVGADLLVRFFLLGTAAEPAAQPVRDAIAKWVLQRDDYEPALETLADLTVRLALDHSQLAAPILDLLLATDDGLVVLCRKLTPPQREHEALALRAVEIAVRHLHRHAATFIADVLVPLLVITPRLGLRINAAFATEIASVLRAHPDAYPRFADHIEPKIAFGLNETITAWMYEQPKQTAGLARVILPRVMSTAGAATASPLAFALARAGEPGAAWFGVLLERAAALDTRVDERASADFTSAVERLQSHPLRLDGALPLLIQLLRGAAAADLRIGKCIRALILLLRPAWREDAASLLEAFDALMEQTMMAA